MSSKLIRRITAVAVAALIPFGATATSAHAATWTPQPQAHVVVADDDAGIGGVLFGCNRSSWS